MTEDSISPERRCSQCGSGFTSARSDQVNCSKACRRLREMERARLSRQMSRGGVPAQKAVVRDLCCPHCGVRFQRRWKRLSPVEFCSLACSHAARVVEVKAKRVYNREASRAAGARRRALKRGATVERFLPVEVLERDGWRCHICHCRTPKKLRGTLAPNAPEVDHIVPLSRGGEHSRRNTACSCRRCNNRKSDKVLGQPSLLALA